MLSCLGVIGAALFGALVLIALRRAVRHRVIEPGGWALAGVLIAAVVAVPDLSTPAIWIGLAACLYGLVPVAREELRQTVVDGPGEALNPSLPARSA